MTEANTAIIPAHDATIDKKEVTFSFRRVKDESGVETRRNPVTLALPVPSVEGIVQILETGGKELDLLMSAVQAVIVDAARQTLSDNSALTSDTFPYGEVTWAAIANQPETERRGRGIAKEIWDDFFKSYIEHMPALLGKPLDVVKKQAAVMAQKFAPLKAHDKKAEILPKFIEVLVLYMQHVPEAEQFAAPIEFLQKKASDMLNEDSSAALAQNLGF